MATGGIYRMLADEVYCDKLIQKIDNYTYPNKKDYDIIISELEKNLGSLWFHNMEKFVIVCLKLFKNMDHSKFREYNKERELCRNSLLWLNYEQGLIITAIDYNLFYYCNKFALDIIISNIETLKFKYMGYTANILGHVSDAQLNYMIHNYKIYNLIKQTTKNNYVIQINNTIKKYFIIKEIFMQDIFNIIYNYIVVVGV